MNVMCTCVGVMWYVSLYVWDVFVHGGHACECIILLAFGLELSHVALQFTKPSHSGLPRRHGCRNSDVLNKK